MTIKLYNQEILDGLEGKVSNNTVAFNCFLEKSTTPTEVTNKTVAAFGEGRNFDLYYIQSILASVGANKNDDWFMAEEIWAAKSTPVHKQLNFMHDEKNIIGVITDSIVLNADGAYIVDESQIGNIKDIATQAVIWTHWDDKKLENNIQKIIASIEENKLFVSMEALFKKFDYMLVKGDHCKVVARNEQTAFLTKYLRSYGGSGEFDGHRIFRILRDFTFSGKGIVDDPANPRSIIDESIFDNSKDCSCDCCDCEDSEESPDDGLEFEDGEETFNEFDSIFAATDKKVKLNKPFRTPGGPKKFSVYVKNDKGNVVKVNFGDPNMSIKRDDPERRKSFRARHNCDNPGPKWKAKYWSCKFWSSTNVSKLVSTKAENIMEDEIKKEVAELKSALAKANETIASMTSKQEVDKASAEIANLKEQVTALKALAEESKAKMEEMEKECAEKMDNTEKECAAKCEDAEAKVKKFEAEKAEANRVSKLIASNVSEDKAREVVKTFASVNDEMFDQIAALYAQKSTAKVEDTVDTSVADAVDAAKAATKPADVVVDKVEQEKDNKAEALVKSISSKLTFINKNKGNK